MKYYVIYVFIYTAISLSFLSVTVSLILYISKSDLECKDMF